jgi:murein DD-endopeptidase MepM/ murein hydrolase activator NlpD
MVRSHRLVATAAALLLVASVAVRAGPAWAQTTGDSGQDLRNAQNQVAQLSQADAASLAQLRAIQAGRATLDGQIAELVRQQAAAEAKLAPLAAEAARIAGIVADLQAQIDVTEHQLEAARIELNATAAEMYRSARLGASSPVGFSGSPEKYLREQKYLKRVSQDRNDLIARVSGLRDDLAGQKRSLHDQQVKADKARDDAAVARDQIAAAKAKLEPARAEAARQEAAEKAALSEIETRLGAAVAVLASLQGASDSIAALLRSKPMPGKAGGCDVRPLNVPINGPFNSPPGHEGVDMAAPMGTPIRACRAGTVVIASWQGGYGNAVVIDHGGNMATLYAHQSQMAASVGQHVEAGQVVGFVGSTGYSTGPHLHFEVRLGGNVVNPENYL